MRLVITQFEMDFGWVEVTHRRLTHMIDFNEKSSVKFTYFGGKTLTCKRKSCRSHRILGCSPPQHIFERSLWT